MTTPAISVVAAVYNGGPYLRRSLGSLLSQAGVDFELIVVDDGSTDGSGRILDELASQDFRMRVIHQANQGLTRALIRGCNEARAPFIARHDSDDLSLPGRLLEQLRLLQLDGELSMVSSWGYGLGPFGEVLFEIVRPADKHEATRQLLSGASGPAGHGSVMFRADAYQRVGGYREAFRFAQDWDLWLRLAEAGFIGYVQSYLYAYRVDERSISARRRQQQEQLVHLAGECRLARQTGQPEAPLLEEAARISAEVLNRTCCTGKANNYFIGKCLLDRRDARSLRYFLYSIRNRPGNVRTWLALCLAILLSVVQRLGSRWGWLARQVPASDAEIGLAASTQLSSR